MHDPHPTPYAEVNLPSMATLDGVFDFPVGLSDDMLGDGVANADLALGATMIEKHVILDRRHDCIDAPFSMEPSEFRALVDAIRATEEALGSANYELSPTSGHARIRRRSSFVTESMRAGEPFIDRNPRLVGSAAGLHPSHRAEVRVRVARRDLVPRAPLAWEDVE